MRSRPLPPPVPFPDAWLLSPLGRIEFAPGESTKTIEVAVRGETDVDGSHSFTLALSDPSNATIGDGSAKATITDDDAGLGAVTLPASVDASRLFCVKATKRCTGLPVGWTVATRGTLVFELTALAPPRTASPPTAAPRRAAGARLIRIVRTTSTAARAQSGRKLLRPTPGRRARQLLRSLRRDRVRATREGDLHEPRRRPADDDEPRAPEALQLTGGRLGRGEGRRA